MKRAISVLILTASLNFCIAQKIKPQLNLIKGHTYYLTSSSASAIIQTANGQQATLNLLFSFKMAFRVVEVSDSLYSMEASYQSLSMHFDIPGSPIDIDSKSTDPKDTTSAIVTAIINKPFNLTITKTGRIRSVTNVDKMLDGTLNNFPQIDSAKKQEVKTRFLQLFGADAFRGSLETGTAIFPDKSVTKEEKWTVVTNLTSPAKAIVTVNYQLADIISNFYLIHGDGSLTTDKNAPPVPLNGLSVKYNLNGTMISDIRIDKTTGWINEVKLRQIMMGEMKIPDSPSTPGGVSIPMSLDTNTTTTGSDK